MICYQERFYNKVTRAKSFLRIAVTGKPHITDNYVQAVFLETKKGLQ